MSKDQFPACFAPREEDVQKMLACEVHVGTRNLEPQMARYMWKRKPDGFYVINLQKTWEKLTLAARVIAAIENPSDVCVVSARPYGQRAALKFSQFTGAHAIAGRFTPGTFTNQIQEKFLEPRLLVITDPRTDDQPLRESSYVNIPTIAFCDSDSNLRHVDIAIPCNNRNKHSIGLMYWLLCREVLHLKGIHPRTTPWEVMVDLFFYRDPEEQEKAEETFEEGAFAGNRAPGMFGEAATGLDNPHSFLENAEAPQDFQGATAVAGDWGKQDGEWGAQGDQGFQQQPATVPAGWGAPTDF